MFLAGQHRAQDMGINYDEALAIAALRRAGVVRRDMLCLGRPELFMNEAELGHVVARAGGTADRQAVKSAAADAFAEPLLKLLGFDHIRSLDASDYEGAEIIHDLNQPLPEALTGATDFLYDGGTMEHVFDVARVLDTMSRLVRPGGTLLISTPANGQCGHGFYQYSPEFFHRALEAHGFCDIRVYLVGLLKPSRWFLAVDPRSAGRRLQFTTAEPMQLIVVARRDDGPGGRRSMPLQSDYAEQSWSAEAGALRRAHEDWRSPKARLRALVRDRLIYPAAIVARHSAGLGMPGLWRRSHFKPFDPMRDAL
jgi:SAM-dependent methyltransferase